MYFPQGIIASVSCSSPLPPPTPTLLSSQHKHFLSLMANSQGRGHLSRQMPSDRDEKRANTPSSINTATLFIDSPMSIAFLCVMFNFCYSCFWYNAMFQDFWFFFDVNQAVTIASNPCLSNIMAAILNKQKLKNQMLAGAYQFIFTLPHLCFCGL